MGTGLCGIHPLARRYGRRVPAGPADARRGYPRSPDGEYQRSGKRRFARIPGWHPAVLVPDDGNYFAEYLVGEMRMVLHLDHEELCLAPLFRSPESLLFAGRQPHGNRCHPPFRYRLQSDFEARRCVNTKLRPRGSVRRRIQPQMTGQTHEAQSVAPVHYRSAGRRGVWSPGLCHLGHHRHSSLATGCDVVNHVTHSNPWR